VLEALGVALRVGLEGALAAAVLRAASARGTAALRALLPAAVIAGLAAGIASEGIARARGLSLAELAPPLQAVRHLHTLGLVGLALLARGRTAGTGGRWGLRVAEVLALAVAAGVLLPEGAFLAGRLRDLSVLAGVPSGILAGAAAGLALAAVAGRALATLAARPRVAAAVTPASALALLFALELAGPAARAVDAHQLPAALTGAVSRAAHDAAHLVFVTLQVPDHAYLEDRVYQLILVFLEPALHAALAAVALLIPIAVGWRAFHRRPGPAMEALARAPDRRAARAAHRRTSWAGAVPFGAAAAVTVAALWAARPDADALYDPLPEPVVDDGAGSLVIPLSSPLGGRDDRMRKWVYAAGDRTITFFTIRRGDGAIVAALDLCEICQPKGYAQMGPAHVFCKYCKTPIPLETVGQPGGCNPVPLPSSLDHGILRVPRAELLSIHARAMADKR
jgi:hypothetical protein